ncbi:CDP-glycerol glycerophosphotransferase family protein [Alcaligenaceae bacterium CGII-47]|nr:CDP-glycerol glycerophosphotransferase family protein [Alcaligenaceae bacterium CGII-47]
MYGSSGGRFSDNAMYAFLEHCHENATDEIYWISNNKHLVYKLRNLGYKALYKWSIEGVLTCLIASEYHYSSYLSDINEWTARGARKVNYWHGCPFKMIEYDIISGYLRKYYNPIGVLEHLAFFVKSVIHPASRISPDKIFSPYPFFDKYIKSAFRVSDSHLVREELPRIKYVKGNLCYGGNEYLGSESLLDDPFLSGGNRVVLYAPTFRDGNSNWFEEHILSDIGIAQPLLAASNILLIIKLHPNESFKEKLISDNIKVIDSSVDIHLILSKIEFLITDYSSIAVDAAMSGIDVYLMWPDLGEYTCSSRDFYIDIDQFYDGRSYSSISNLIFDITNNNASYMSVKDIILNNIKPN